MDKPLELERIYKEKTESSTAYSTIITILISFIVLNTVKLTVFNYLIMTSKTFDAFIYKAFWALLVNLIFYPLMFRFRSRLPIIILYVVQSIYIFAYMSYYTYFGNYLHLFQAFALFTEGVGPIKHFTIPVNFSMLIILIDLPVFIKLVLHYGEANLFNKALKNSISLLRRISLFIILCMEIWNFAHGCFLLQLNKTFYTSEPRIIERYGTFINNISDITVNYGGENMINHFKYGKTVSASAESSESPNIIAIQVESMDSEVINQKHNDEYVAPYLHSLSQQSIYYPYVLSYHKSGGTSDSEFSIINSIEPLGNYPSIKIPKYNYPNSFVKLLNKSDYYTMAFHGNSGNYYNRDVAFDKMGFDEFSDINKMKLKEAGWGAPDHKVFDYVLDKMGNQRSPFFAYVITMSSHMPFENTAGYYSNKSYDDIEDATVRNYFTAMSYVDQSIQDFVEKVKTKYPNTCILIWGDHTPGIDSPDYKQASYTNASDYYEFVPFLMLTPDKKVYQEDEYAASFLDISPTILYAAGAGFTVKTNGVNLADLPADMPMIPFKEKFHDRRELYRKITQETSVQGTSR